MIKELIIILKIVSITILILCIICVFIYLLGEI